MDLRIKRKFGLILLLSIALNSTLVFAGDATLSWNPPTTNKDGSPLADLAGYILYYDTTSGKYNNSIDVGDLTTYQVENLTEGLTYYFAVTAYDTSSNESEYSNEVSKTIELVNNPPNADPGGPYTGFEGQAITLDGSKSTDSDGSIVLYAWDTDNDGTYDYSSSSPMQSHTYVQQGTYMIKFRVTDNLGATDEALTTANISDTSPTADFTGFPTGGMAPLTVNFTDNSTGYDQPLTYEWDIDNNGTIDSTAQTPSYIYINPGTYTVKLTLTDSDGSTNTLTRTDYINVTASAYTIVAVAGSGGSISPSGNVMVNKGNEQTFIITPATDYQVADVVVDGIPQGALATYIFANVTADHTIEVSFTMNEYDLSCPDSGNIECLERTDAGSDSDNLDNGMPKVSIEYEFQITVKDSSGNAPQYVRLYMTQRNTLSSNDFYSYDVICSGDYSTGATCTYVTKLGPAAIHKFYFEVKISDGTTLKYPLAGYITGPEVQLLTGYNLVGIPRDIGNDVLDGSMAFETVLTYRWDTDVDFYTKVTTTEPVKTGEGYFLYKEAATLPEFDKYGEIPDTEFTYELKPGWNIISNPYSGNVVLSDIKVRKGDDIPLTWTEAASNGWLTNAIYYNSGIDWGDTYYFETEPEATLTPWMGYWTYLNMTDDTYSLIISKP